eukprot:9578850-Lingulodinium_polyedra.AAC.1
MDVGDPDFLVRGALQWLESHGLAHQFAQDGVSSTWGLSERAALRVNILQEVHSPRSAFTPRRGVPIKELTACELLQKLDADGWEYYMKESRVAMAGRGRAPQDYQVGGEL